MRILVALADGGEVAGALDWLRAFQARLSAPARVVLLHVVPVLAQGVEGVAGGFAAADLEAFRQASGPGEFRLRAGTPGPVVCEEAVGFDLLVLGASRRSQLGELVWGSTAAYVVHHAPCDVLLRRRV